MDINLQWCFFLSLSTITDKDKEEMLKMQSLSQDWLKLSAILLMLTSRNHMVCRCKSLKIFWKKELLSLVNLPKLHFHNIFKLKKRFSMLSSKLRISKFLRLRFKKSLMESMSCRLKVKQSQMKFNKNFSQRFRKNLMPSLSLTLKRSARSI